MAQETLRQIAKEIAENEFAWRKESAIEGGAWTEFEASAAETRIECWTEACELIERILNAVDDRILNDDRQG